MSNLSQAIANDYNRYKVGGGRAGKFNPQVMTKGQDDIAPMDEWQMRKDMERQIKRTLRVAEGGRAGGFNDRYPIEKIEQNEEDEVDEFGRRKRAKTESEKKLSKEERAKLALERLRQKQKNSSKEEGQASGSSAGMRQHGSQSHDGGSVSPQRGVPASASR